MSDVKREDEEAQEPAEETPPEDSEAEGDESEESEEAPPPSRKPRRPVPAGPPSEESLNAPSRQTVGMLGVVAAATLVMWAAGRAACNYHEPGESLSPRAVALEARTRSPKDAALEFAHRWLTADFDIASKLAAGDAAAAVTKDRGSCTGDACNARKNAATTALSVAEVVQGNPVESFVRVRTEGLPQGTVIKMLGVERIGQEWKVTRELDPSAPLPALKEPPAPTAAPGASGVIEVPLNAIMPPGSAAPPQATAPGSAPVVPPPAPRAPAPQAPAPQGAAPKATPPAAAPQAPAPQGPAQPKP